MRAKPGLRSLSRTGSLLAVLLSAAALVAPGCSSEDGSSGPDGTTTASPTGTTGTGVGTDDGGGGTGVGAGGAGQGGQPHGGTGQGGVGAGTSLSPAMQWVRDNPMFISALSVSVGPPSAAVVHEYFDDFHANGVHLWSDGLPTEMDAWQAPNRPDFRYVAWVTPNGTSAANGQLLGGYPPNAPGRIAYQIDDEPRTMEDLLALQVGIDAVRAHDPGAFIIVNFYTHVDNADEMAEHYAEHMGGDIISYDRYTYSKRAYASLERYRRVGLAHGMPYWRYIKSYWTDGGSCDLSESDLRWQAFSGFVYGYTAVHWFVYQIGDFHEPEPCLYTTHGGFTAPKTNLWHVAAQLNVEMAHLGRAITQLTSTDVRYIPSFVYVQPEGTTNWSVGAGGDPFITAVAPAPGNPLLEILVGYFQDDAGERYLMVQNQRHAKGDWPVDSSATGTIRLTFDFGGAPAGFDMDRVQSLNRANGSVEDVALANSGGSVRTLDVTLAAGNPFLFKYATGAPFALQ